MKKYEERNSELQKKLKSDIPFSSYVIVKKQSTKIYPNLSYFFAKDDNYSFSSFLTAYGRHLGKFSARNRMARALTSLYNNLVSS